MVVARRGENDDGIGITAELISQVVAELGARQITVRVF